MLFFFFLARSNFISYIFIDTFWIIVVLTVHSQNKQVHQQDSYPANAGRGLHICSYNCSYNYMEHPLFKGNISLLLIVCLYVAYSKLLKLQQHQMQVVHEKIAILDEYLFLASITAGSSRVINIWTVKYRLYHVSIERLVLQMRSTCLWQMMLKNTQKMQHIFGYNGLPWGQVPLALHL